MLYPGPLDEVSVPVKVVLHSLQPSDIVMGMWHQMHIDKALEVEKEGLEVKSFHLPPRFYFKITFSGFGTRVVIACFAVFPRNVEFGIKGLRGGHEKA